MTVSGRARPRAFPECVLIGRHSRILCPRVETECRIVVSEQCCRACILIKGGRFNCTLRVLDSRLFPHQRSALASSGEKYYNRAAFMRAFFFLPCPFTTRLITSNQHSGLLMSGTAASQLPKRRACWIRPSPR